MDSRHPIKRPFTKMDSNPLDQPMGRSGIDPMQQQPLDPVRTLETPLTIFPPDIIVGINSNLSIPLPRNCSQIAFISVTPGLAASFNGYGGRTIKDGFVMNGAFQSLQVATDATGTCIIQLAGY
jgi:hypothetical protein